MTSKHVSLDFYGIGNFPQKNIEIPILKYNSAFKDTSNDIFTRNKLSINTENPQNLRNSTKENSLKSSNIELNNYLNPLKVFKNDQKYNLKDNLVNQETYRLTKDKCYAK